MPDELVCPNCHVGLDERQLVTNTWSVESCPYCRAMVRRHEGFRWQRRDALVLADVAAVEAWLAATAHARGLTVTRKSDREEKGEYRWEVTGLVISGIPLPWICTAMYMADSPGVCELRLTS